MEPLKKKRKLDIVDMNYKFEDLSLKRKNNIKDDEIKKINKKIKLEINNCGIEYIKFNKKNNEENDDDSENEFINKFKRLPPNDLIYRYII